MLGTRVVDLRDKVREGKDIGLSKQEIGDLLGIETDAHDAVADQIEINKLWWFIDSL